MDKILVEIYLPAANKTFDVYISLDSYMYDVLVMVSKCLTDLSDNKFMATENTIICNRDTGIIYNINKHIGELDIKNGTRLILI